MTYPSMFYDLQMFPQDVSKFGIIKAVNLCIAISLRSCLVFICLGGGSGVFDLKDYISDIPAPNTVRSQPPLPHILCSLVCSSCVYSTVLLQLPVTHEANLPLSLFFLFLSPFLCIFCIRVCCCFMIALPLFALSSAFHLLFTTFLCCFFTTIYCFISLVHSTPLFPLPSPSSTLLFVKCLLCICKLFSFVYNLPLSPAHANRSAPDRFGSVLCGCRCCCSIVSIHLQLKSIDIEQRQQVSALPRPQFARD